MKPIHLLPLLGFSLPYLPVFAQTSALAPAPQSVFLNSASPLVGTSEHGHIYPGATVPFGMLQLSPDTRTEGWDGCSGYHYSDSAIRGFSHTHLSGTGCGGLGDLLLMPIIGAVRLSPGDAQKGDGYASHFSHANEVANPGYYRVFLDTPKVTAELTATARSGLHRYHFPASKDAHVVLDLQHGIHNSVEDSGLTFENDSTISGYRISNDWGGRRSFYFVLQFSKPFASYGIEKDSARVATGVAEINGKSVKAFVNYQTGEGEAVLVRVGISGTSIEGARKNLKAEIPDWNFERILAQTRAQWNETLDDIQIETKDAKIRRTFYSNLYQSYLAPTLFSDVDGTYRGGDGKNHVGKFQNYTTFSLWDTFRAQHPLLTITQPKRVPDMVNSMLALYTERGQNEMPVWPLWGNETGTMIGYNSAPVVVDAYLKGFRGFDAEVAFQSLKATALNPRNGQDEFGKYGYVLSADGQKQSVARTLEFAFNDWCIARLAQELGHKEDARLFFNRSANFVNLFDSTTTFMRGRFADGSWRRPFRPKQLVWGDYTEANAWHYSWAVMHDAPKLAALMGGDTAFGTKLDTLFSENSEYLAEIPDITGLIGQYAHGNEPVHHVAYLYNAAGQAPKTQSRVRDIMARFYNDTPTGAPGNNDCGQMSAWYIFSALGFYPLNPADGNYVIGSPVVDKATIFLDKKHYGGRKFTVVARDNSPKNIYVQSVTLNGKPLSKTWISHAQLVAGGELRVRDGAKPNLKWGQNVSSRPPSGLPASFAYPTLPAPSSIQVQKWDLPIRVVVGSNNSVAGFSPDFANEDGGYNGNENVVDVSVPNAAPAAVYQSERYSSDNTFRYPVPQGATYTVRLHFAEIFNAAPKSRVQNVQINGREVLKNFDIAAEVGLDKALVKEFTGIAPDADGNIVIRVSAAPASPDQNAKISAIEILKP